MIDNYDQAMNLVRKIEANLPIPARPTKALTRLMKNHGIKLASNRELSIKHVFYTGDEGGISCDITPPGQEPIICSITQIKINPRHPLAADIRAYQTERKKRLAQTEQGGRPSHFTIEPRRKRKR